MFTKTFSKGFIGSYIQDYNNIQHKKEISGDEFKELLEKHTEHTTTTTTTTGWGKKAYSWVPYVNNLMINKNFICVIEATTETEGLVIGIHDFNNFKAVVDKIVVSETEGLPND